MSKHTPGQWKWWTSNSYRRLMAGTTPVAYPYVCSDGHPDIQISEEDARRIVACVNACEGISTEALEEHGKNSDASLALIDSYARQRDELLEALRNIVEADEGQRLTQGDINQGKAAISKATGAA